MALIYGEVDPHDLRRQEARTVRFGIDEYTVAAMAEDSGSVVGYTDVSQDPLLPTVARIGGTAVDPSWRGRGIARWLKVEAMNLAFQRLGAGRAPDH
jgi:RimJ/RimL family protein N-acetyltransferase